MKVRSAREEPLRSVRLGFKVCPVVEKVLSSLAEDAGIASTQEARVLIRGNLVMSFQNANKSPSLPKLPKPKHQIFVVLNESRIWNSYYNAQTEWTQCPQTERRPQTEWRPQTHGFIKTHAPKPNPPNPTLLANLKNHPTQTHDLGQFWKSKPTQTNGLGKPCGLPNRTQWVYSSGSDQ